MSTIEGFHCREISLTSGPGLLVVLEPVVELDSLGALHGDAVQEVLGEVALVEPRLLHHLALRDGVLVHVLLDGLGHEGLVTAMGGGGGGRCEKMAGYGRVISVKAERSRVWGGGGGGGGGDVRKWRGTAG